MSFTDVEWTTPATVDIPGHLTAMESGDIFSARVADPMSIGHLWEPNSR